MSETIDLIPGKFVQDDKGNVEWIQAEGGFVEGSQVRIALAGDEWSGKRGTIQKVFSERFCWVTNGEKTYGYCVAALRHA